MNKKNYTDLFSKTLCRTLMSMICAATLSFLPARLALAQELHTIKIGTMEGEESDIWVAAQEEAKKAGIDLQIVKFSDYVLPNEALNSGDIDANAFQHTPYLDAQIEQRGYKLSVVGETLLYPIGVYSSKIHNLKDLPDGATVGIPNDPSNGGRALLLLQQLGFLKLKDPNNILATKNDIAENPKKLKIQELDAGVLGRALTDFDIAIINTGWALTAGLNPEKEAIAFETAQNNPYTNIIVVRTQDKDAPWVKGLVSSFQSEAVRAKIKEIFGALATTPW